MAVTTPHQQYFLANQDDVHILPDEISHEEGTWMSLACTTQLGVRRAEFELGAMVGIVGMGMLGQLIAQYLRLSGARIIIAIDPIQKRLGIAKKSGATHTLSLDVRSSEGQISEINGGRMLDVVYDITGRPDVLASCIPLVRKLGKVVLLGDTTTPNQQYLGPGVVFKSVAILGIHAFTYPEVATIYNPWTYKEMTSLFFEYLMQDKINVKELITHRFSPEQATSVYEKLLVDRADSIGVIFDWDLLK